MLLIWRSSNNSKMLSISFRKPRKKLKVKKYQLMIQMKVKPWLNYFVKSVRQLIRFWRALRLTKKSQSRNVERG